MLVHGNINVKFTDEHINQDAILKIAVCYMAEICSYGSGEYAAIAKALTHGASPLPALAKATRKKDN